MALDSLSLLNLNYRSCPTTDSTVMSTPVSFIPGVVTNRFFMNNSYYFSINYNQNLKLAPYFFNFYSTRSQSVECIYCGCEWTSDLHCSVSSNMDKHLIAENTILLPYIESADTYTATSSSFETCM